jgi:hypothetical protein
MGRTMTARHKLPPHKIDELRARRQAGERLKVLSREYGLAADYIPKLVGPIHQKLSQAMQAVNAGRANQQEQKP